MARLIRVDGTEEAVTPANGRKFTLKELQSLVGGPIEIMGSHPRFVFCEEGRTRGLPLNLVATNEVHRWMARKLNVAMNDLSREVGRRLIYLPALVGPVVVLEKGDRM